MVYSGQSEGTVTHLGVDAVASCLRAETVTHGARHRARRSRMTKCPSPRNRLQAPIRVVSVILRAGSSGVRLLHDPRRTPIKDEAAPMPGAVRDVLRCLA